MVKLTSALAAICLSSLFVGAASAVEIENEDESTYEVTVTEGNDSNSFTLGPGMRERDLCEEKCTISVQGRGQIEAQEDDVVVIREGSLSKRL